MTAIRAKSVFLSLSAFLLVFSTGLRGAATAADSRITAVTVYADRAIVTRTAAGMLTAGEHALVFENLPAGLLDQSLQASGRGVEGAIILDLTTQNIFVQAAANERVKTLEDPIKVLQRQLRTLDERGKVLEESRGFVQRMLQTSTTATAGPAARPTLEEWQRLLVFAEESLGKFGVEQQALDIQREELRAKEAVLNRQLGELRDAREARTKTVTVRVLLTNPGRFELAIRYAMPNAGWTPSYDARLRSAARVVDLAYFGVVRNGTGEDWKDVELTLSTARPGAGGAAPESKPWIVDLRRSRPAGSNTLMNPDMIGEIGLILNPVDAESGRGNAQVQVTTKGRAESARNKAVVLADQPEIRDAGLLAAAVESAVTSATFKIPVTVSVPGNNVSQKVAIKDTHLDATLQFQSTPKLIESAFLVANANNTSDYPLLAGPMNTFLDDTFIAASSLKTVMPGEKFDLALGADDGISVKRRLVNRFTEDTGLTNKSRRVTYDVVVTLTNNKSTAERVVFKEPTPIPRDEKIVVKLLTPQEKEIGNLNNPKEVSREEDGKLVWRVTLKPGEKREFSLKMSVEHPGDILIAGLE